MAQPPGQYCNQAQRKRVSYRVRSLLIEQNYICECGGILKPNNLVEFEDKLTCNLCNMKRLGLIH